MFLNVTFRYLITQEEAFGIAIGGEAREDGHDSRVSAQKLWDMKQGTE